MIVKNISIKFQLVKAHLIFAADSGCVNILDMKCNNSYIRKCLNQYISCYPKAILKWKPFFSFSMPSSETIWSANIFTAE